MSEYSPFYTITPEILNLSYEIAAILERIDIIREKALTPQLRRENRIKTIHSSLYIEANSLTIEQVTDVMDGKHIAGPEKDIKEVKNAITAYDELLDCDPYSEQHLLKQHGLLMNGLTPDAGRYRSGDVGIFSEGTPIHVAPPAKRVPILIACLLDWVKNISLPQVVKSCIFHYEFEFIHPFSDGNGRMGRMWQTLLLYQESQIFAWLPVETIVAFRQEEYYKAIRRSTNHNDSGIFAQFMLTALRDAMVELRKQYDKGEIKTENDNLKLGVKLDVKLGVNQIKIIELLKSDPFITIKDLAQQIKISETAVQNNLKKLKIQGVVNRAGSDKNGQWIVVEKSH